MFMFHDLEEIIMIRPWLSANSASLMRRFPRLFIHLLPHFQRLSTSSFAAGVAVIFFFLSLLTFLTVENEWYSLWMGVLIGFFAHLIVHFVQYLVYGKYVPVIITSTISSVYCVYALFVVPTRVSIDWMLTGIWSLLAIVMIAVSLPVIHWFVSHFEDFLRKSFPEP
jgi:hypothetical protein